MWHRGYCLYLLMVYQLINLDSQNSNIANNCMVKKIAETAGDNAAGTNIGWLIQQFWDNLPLQDKMRSAILINNYILRCTSVDQKTFSTTTRYMNGSIFIWQSIVAAVGQYVEVSAYYDSQVAINDYSAAHVGNAALYVL